MKLVLIRHGESVWNKENRFTGWTDVDLSLKGVEEAKEAGIILKEKGYTFDIAYTSVLKRANRTLDFVLEELGEINIPVVYDYRLNERHYGALQGLNKAETAEEYGDEQVHIWRRSPDVRPPALEPDDERHPKFDPKYKDIPEDKLPATEHLLDTLDRVIECYNESISKDIKEGKEVLIVAHGNSLRALVMYLDNMDKESIMELNIPTGVPLVYELDDDLKPIKHYYLED